jgi:hypothetical protein
MQNRRFITGWILVIWGIIGLFPIIKEIKTQVFEFSFYNIIGIIIWLIIYLTGCDLIKKSLNEK